MPSASVTSSSRVSVRTTFALLPFLALTLAPALASAYEDCGNGYYCDGDQVCNSSNTGCMPSGAIECNGGYCYAGETCCSDGCGTSGCGTTTTDDPTTSDTPTTGGDGYTCASESLSYDGGSCSVDFCATSDLYDCYYEVNGTTVSCSDCSDIYSCAQEAADVCLNGSSDGGDDGGYSGNDTCEWAFDGECDEGMYCDYGTDTSDCDGGGCSIAAQPGAPSSLFGGWSAAAGLLTLLGFAVRRRLASGAAR